MALTTPEWLARRGGELRAHVDGRSWAVLLDGEPQYLLVPTPAAGKYSCQVTQTINGKRLDRGGAYPSAEDAIRAGLEELRNGLGW